VCAFACVCAYVCVAGGWKYLWVLNLQHWSVIFCTNSVEDEERNDGSADKPYYMSSDLKGILGKKNKSDETD